MDEILTARLRLRRARPDDLDDIHAALSDPQATRYWSTPPHGSITQSRAWLENMIAATDDKSDDFVVELQGRVIGKAGFYRLPEIGYLLHPNWWGQGLGREAVGAVIARVWRRFDLPRITADVDPRNVASLRLLKSFGFVETGFAARTFLRDEEWCDSLYLAMERPPDA